MTRACIPRSAVRCGRAWPMQRMAPASSAARYSRNAAQMISSTSMVSSRARVWA
jgi:hypothetical protein